MRTLLFAAGLALAAAPAAAQARIAVPAPSADPLTASVGFDDSRPWDPRWDHDDRWGRERVSVELRHDRRRPWYRSGERPRMALRTQGRAYVAAVHIDTEGRVEILYPASPWSRGEVHGRRTLSLAPSASYGGHGVGYVFAVASDYPLDFARFEEWRGRGWRRDVYVWGDPYHAMRRITRSLLDGGFQDLLDTDYLGYRVGQGARYPSWACSGRGEWDARRGGHNGRCDRVHARLRRDPGYYDGVARRGNLQAAPERATQRSGEDEGGIDFGGEPEGRVEPDRGVERERDIARPRVAAPRAGEDARVEPRPRLP